MNQIILIFIKIINMGKVTRKDLLDSGLTNEFIIGLDKKFEEYQKFPECISMLTNYIKEHDLTKTQQKLIAQYIRQLLQNIRGNPSKGNIGLMSSVGTGAAIGAVQAGGAFAMLQNMGAVGAFAGPVGLLAGTAAGLGVIGAKFF